MRLRVLALVSASALLSACGGGGGGVASTPTPPATPPTPPAPPPAQTNASLADLKYSESFANDAATGSATFNASGTYQNGTSGTAALTVNYNATDRSYTLSTGGRSQTFSPSDRDAVNSSAQADVYVRSGSSATDSLTLTRPGSSGSLTYTYVGAGIWQRTANDKLSGSIDAFTYGVTTPAAGVPRTGSGSYIVDLLGVIASNGSVLGVHAIRGSGTLDVNFANGNITTSGNINASPLPGGGYAAPGSFMGTATLSSSANAFAGTLRLSESEPFTGPLNGRFYGPAANEVGAAFSGTGQNFGVVAGTIIGPAGTGRRHDGDAAQRDQRPGIEHRVDRDQLRHAIARRTDHGTGFQWQRSVLDRYFPFKRRLQFQRQHPQSDLFARRCVRREQQWPLHRLSEDHRNPRL